MAKNSLSLPDELVQLLAASDKAKNFPPGTMASLLRQEIEGRPDILARPDTPHYPTGVTKNGVRSSAFGPFGILESTGRDPGYGVSPLKDKSLAEQVRFAADYLDARSKSAGSLQAGLAGYGEGEKYARNVARRRDGAAPGQLAQVQPEIQVNTQNSAPPQMAVNAIPVQPVQPLQVGAPAPADPEKDIWGNYLKTTAAPVTPEAMAYGPKAAAAAPAKAPGLSPEELAEIYNVPLTNRPNFGAFQGLARLGRRTA